MPNEKDTSRSSGHDVPVEQKATLRACRVEGCDRRIEGDELCSLHRRRMQRHGSTDPRMCWGEGCTNFIKTRGDFCPDCRPKPLPCTFEGCEYPRNSAQSEFCGRHAFRVWKFGDPHITLARDEHDAIIDSYTLRLLTHRHDSRCLDPDFQPAWVWRQKGFQPRPDEQPLAGTKFAWRIFCRHQLEAAADGTPMNAEERHLDRFPDCDLYEVHQAYEWKKLGMKPRSGERALRGGPYAYRLWCQCQLVPLDTKQSRYPWSASK